ncbi:hypothetical protein DM02DRAFT_475106, partial [Periconia macrospinosa]
KAISLLIYLIIGIRPNIAFTVSALLRYIANPTLFYTTTIKRIFYYLNSTYRLKLTFR